MIDRVKKMETLEQKDLPALEKSLKDYHVACMGTVPLLPFGRQAAMIGCNRRSEVKDIGNKLGAELRRLGEIVPDNEWGSSSSI